MTDRPYLEHRHVTLSEERLPSNSVRAGTIWWTATASGPLIPTKVRVDLSRGAPTAGEALQLLEKVMNEQGWDLR